MTEAVAERLDARALRADFPAFERRMRGHPLAYLDSAASAQKPRQVLDAERELYEGAYANVHRGVYELADKATEAYEGAREIVRSLLNARSSCEVIFTRGTTEALNLVAYSWGLDNVGEGDVVVVTDLEHHANFVPWQFVAHQRGARFVAIPIDAHGELDLDALDGIAALGPVKVVAVGLVSNTLGTINPVERLARWAHEHGAILVADGAQAVPNRSVDVQALDCDFLAFSGHKMCGPTGIGALWGRQELLERMRPFLYGGEMIRKVSVERTTWNELPYKFEAGTPPIAQAVGLGAAIDYVTAAGLDAIERHELELVRYTVERLGELPFVRQFGPAPDRRGGIVSFEVDGVHPHDVAQILDGQGIAVRAGHHCTQPLMQKLGVTATTRASFGLYSLPDEVDRLVDALRVVQKTFR